MWPWIRRIVLYGPLTVVLALVVVYLALPWPVVYRWDDPSSTSFMRYRQRQARDAGEVLELRHAWVPLDRISEPMKRAVIAAEDGRFREHGGIDWWAIADELEYDGEAPFSWTDPDDLRAAGRAAAYYWRNRDEVRGRSTITQQLAKNLYFTPERSLKRKAGEFVVAKRLERFLDKDRILELYLNTVELGPGLFGVEAAARHYFGTSAAELTPFQAASLAATLPHPLSSNPETRPGRMAWRRDLILERLQRGGRADRPVPVAPERLETPDVAVDVPSLDDPADAVPAAESVGPDGGAGAGEGDAATPAPPDAPPRDGAPADPPPSPAPPPPDTLGDRQGMELAPPSRPDRRP